MDGLAAEQPVVIVVEDAHTLSGAMLDLIERLGSRPRGGGRRSLTLALTRTELLDERPSWGSNAINAVLLRMDPLSMDEAIVLARQAGGGLITDDEAIAIAKRTGGNPFFIVETTGMLLPENDGGPRMSGAALPPTVQAVVTARLDALPPRLRTLTRRASVFRYSFDLEELLSIDPDVTTDELHQLQEAEIVVRQEGGGSPYWRMRHSMLRDVAYGSLPKRERMRLHTTIADRLISLGYHSFAAEHLELAARASLDLNPLDRRIPDRAVDQLILAGDRARRRMLSRAAVDQYERALAMAGPEEAWGVREGRALGGLGEARYWLGEYQGATEVLTRAEALGESQDDPFTLALALRFLGDIAINIDADLEKAETLLERSLLAAERLGDPWAITRTLLFAGWVPWTRDRYDDAEVHLAARARGGRPGRPVGTDPRAHRVVDQPRQPRRPGGRARADRGRRRARRRRGRSVQRGGRDRPARACDRGPRADGRGPRRDRAGHLHLRGARRAVGTGRRAGRARHPQARGRPAG